MTSVFEFTELTKYINTIDFANEFPIIQNNKIIKFNNSNFDNLKHKTVKEIICNKFIKESNICHLDKITFTDNSEYIFSTVLPITIKNTEAFGWKPFLKLI